MEDWKLEKLHETLSKLRPNGHLGLGSRSHVSGVGYGHKDNGLPKNGLYSRFVREGHFKKKFDSDSDGDNHSTTDRASMKEAKKQAKRKRSKSKNQDDEHLLKKIRIDDPLKSNKKKSKKRDKKISELDTSDEPPSKESGGNHIADYANDDNVSTSNENKKKKSKRGKSSKKNEKDSPSIKSRSKKK